MSISLTTTPEPVTSVTPACLSELREMAIRALPRMYRPAERIFAFRLKRHDGRDVLEGVSGRYTAIVLLAIAQEPNALGSELLAGHDPCEVCEALVERLDRSTDAGEVALGLWAANLLGVSAASRARKRLEALDPLRSNIPTVELAWVLSALLAEPGASGTDPLVRGVFTRLCSAFDDRSGLFRHWPSDVRAPRLRAHVSCFADFVYPVQALSSWHALHGDGAALDKAKRCAERIVALQGPAGQWWWHFDVRTGRVVEGYPVYAIHQDAMGPMALFALQEACGIDHRAATARGLEWLLHSPEIEGSLVDREFGVIWRKVARREPNKLSRGMQAAASSVHPRLRVPGTDLIFPPGRIDAETRPYHMGWLLFAWTRKRIEEWGASATRRG